MSAADDNDNNNGDDNDKGERKRQREKKRRSDLATAFEELQVVFNIVEPPSVVYNRATTESEAADGGNATRLELIRKTTEALRRLHQENMDMRRAMGGHRTDETMVTGNNGTHQHPVPGFPDPRQSHYYPGYAYHPSFYRGYPLPSTVPPPHEQVYGEKPSGWDAGAQQHVYDAPSAPTSQSEQNAAPHSGQKDIV